MKTKTLKQTGILISGIAVLNLWGGGTGSIEMERYFLPLNKATKDNILRCVNDNGFGCESIQSAEIEIYDVYGNYSEYNRTIETDCKHHSFLFNGWRELREQGIEC